MFSAGHQSPGAMMPVVLFRPGHSGQLAMFCQGLWKLGQRIERKEKSTDQKRLRWWFQFKLSTFQLYFFLASFRRICKINIVKRLTSSEIWFWIWVHAWSFRFRILKAPIQHLTLKTKCWSLSGSEGEPGWPGGLEEINVFIVALDITGPDWHVVNLYKIKLRPAEEGPGSDQAGAELFLSLISEKDWPAKNSQLSQANLVNC